MALTTGLHLAHERQPASSPTSIPTSTSKRRRRSWARESWHPRRWHAYIDGVETEIQRVSPDFPAIDVPPGKHTLAFRFERPWWAHAAWLAWPGVVLGAWRLRKRDDLPAARTVES